MAIYVYTNQRDGGVAHIPSSSEFEDLKSIMDWLSLTTGNAYTQKLHMPFAGYRKASDASIDNQGTYGFYWSSSPFDYPARASLLLLRSSNVVADGQNDRCHGGTVRLFLDEYLEPDNTRTVEAWTIWSAWIFHNATLGVISVTNGSDKNITMKDKNVWATTVYNSWDTRDESNCGKYFQRWNYYWFPFTWTVTTSTTKVNTTGYGWNNPYSSSTFITWADRSNPSNDNLRTDSWENYFVIE